MDRQRPLNKRGHRNAADMAGKFASRGSRPDLLISSPAKRAITTAHYFADEFQYPSFDIQVEERLYFCGVKGWINTLKSQSDEYRSVLLFGHNPEITQIVDWLSGDEGDALPTCTIVQLELDLNSWSELSSDSARLLYRWSPKDPIGLVSTLAKGSSGAANQLKSSLTLVNSKNH